MIAGEMFAFPVPSRVVLEGPGGARAAAYVAEIEPSCVWVYTREPLPDTFRAHVRLTFRLEGGPSLGMSGRVVWRSQDRASIEIAHPLDRALIREWARGRSADLDRHRAVVVEAERAASGERSPRPRTRRPRASSRVPVTSEVPSRRGASPSAEAQAASGGAVTAHRRAGRRDLGIAYFDHFR